jgi:hypothetical protein
VLISALCDLVVVARIRLEVRDISCCTGGYCGCRCGKQICRICGHTVHSYHFYDSNVRIVLYCTYNRIVLTTVLYLQLYCTYKCTVLTNVLYLQPYCTYNHTVLTNVLYSQPYCTYNHTVYLQPYCTYNCTVLTTILYLQPYCTCSI